MRIVDVPGEWRRWVRIVTEVSEPDVEHYLTEAERTEVFRLRLPERQLERAASRIAGKILLSETGRADAVTEVEFAKDQDRPFARLRGSTMPVSVSFTHAHGLGGAAAGDSPVGMDIERLREIRPEMTRFYLTSEELSSTGQLDVAFPLLHFWSAKEAAFKMSGAHSTLLKTPLRVVEQSASGLLFEVVDTSAVVETRIVEGHFIVALARA